MVLLSQQKLPARLDSLPHFIQSVSKCAENQGFGDSKISDIRLALEEAMVNIFSYAYPDQAGSVEVCCKLDEDTSLIIEIIDKGIPFNPEAVVDPELSNDLMERKVGGLGVLLIRAAADEVRHSREGDDNILTLVFTK